MGTLAAGFAFMETENRTEKLYIPQNSESIRNLKKAREYGFDHALRKTEVILLSKVGTNVLTQGCFRDALLLHESITNIPGYLDYCLPLKKDVKPLISSQCVTEEPLGIFNYNSSQFESLLTKLNNEQMSEGRLFHRVLGKISRSNLGQITSAKAIRLTYYLKGSNLDEAISEKIIYWEKEFLNRMKAFDSNRLKCGTVYYTTGRSLEDSIAESTEADIILIMITYITMISFACLMLGKYRNPLTGHGLLAMGGVLSVGCGIMAALGFCMLIKTPFVRIVGVLPFLIVGVGIDDMFIIVDELDRTHPDQAIPVRLDTVMRNIGPAITMTTMTDLLAFAVGTTSKFPSIVYFCTYAAFSIALAFFFLITIFVAFMTYDCRRMNAGRRDIVPCLKAPDPGLGKKRWDEPRPQTLNKIMELWGKILMKPTVKGVVLIISLLLLGFGIYGTTFIDEEFDRRDLAKDGSEFIKFIDISEAYFTEDIRVDIILESGVNYSSPSTQREILDLSHIVTNNRYYRPNVISWFSEFQNWSASQDVTIATSNFVASLTQFLETHPKFKSDVLFSADHSTVVASRLYCFIKRSKSSVALRDAMTTLRSALSEKSDLPVFANAYVFIFFEQFVLTLPETIRNLVLAATAIFVVTSLFLVNPLVVIVVVLGFASLIFELLGKKSLSVEMNIFVFKSIISLYRPNYFFQHYRSIGLMHIWGVSLNSIAMINLVLAIGFAVDYSSHIAHAFVFSRETNPEEKVINAMRTVGASVLMGGRFCYEIRLLFTLRFHWLNPGFPKSGS